MSLVSSEFLIKLKISTSTDFFSENNPEPSHLKLFDQELLL